MTSTQLPPLAAGYPLSFQSTAASLSSLFARRPLFSIACSLFSENTRGGGTSTNLPFGISNFQPLFSVPVCKTVTPAVNPAFCPRLGASAAIDLFPLCFHTLTNPFSRKPFLFTSIQNPRGGTARRLFGCHLLRLSKGFTARGPQARAYFFATAFTR